MEFVVTRQRCDGYWGEQGRVKLNRRCVPDGRLKDNFPPVTRSYKEVLEGCRFLSIHLPAKSIDWELTNRPYKVRIYRLDEYLGLI